MFAPPAVCSRKLHSLVLMPQDRFNQLYKEYCDLVGMRFAFTICPQVEEGAYLLREENFCEVLEQCIHLD
jgi:hypothetical protein